MKNYFIKTGYVCNLDSKGRPIPYLDYESNLCQFDAYKFANRIIKKYKLKNVLDIGCGFGLKLKKLIHPICDDIVGVDTERSINFCKQTYHFGQWFADDIENPSLILNKKFDLIISFDVIEHLVDPDKLLSYIKRYSHDNTFIIISTPERDLVTGKDNFGPPDNLSHIREWNMSEFQKYINSNEFQIIKHFLVKDRKTAPFRTTLELFLKYIKGRRIKDIKEPSAEACKKATPFRSTIGLFMFQKIRTIIRLFTYQKICQILFCRPKI